MKKSMEVKKLKIELPYDPAILRLGKYLEKTTVWKNMCTPVFNCSTASSSQDKEETSMSINRWIDKDVVHIHNGILLSHWKECNNVTCGNMNEPRDDHTKWSKSEKDKYYNGDMWNIKKWYKWIYLQNRNRLTDLENKLRVTKRERWRGGINWEFGINIHSLLCIT